MAGFDPSGFTLAMIAILVVFAALLLLTIGQTIYGMLRDRKSEDTGEVEDDMVLKGVDDTGDGMDTESNPSVGKVEERERGPLKSYDTDFDDLDAEGLE